MKAWEKDRLWTRISYWPSDVHLPKNEDRQVLWYDFNKELCLLCRSWETSVQRNTSLTDAKMAALVLLSCLT